MEDSFKDGRTLSFHVSWDGVRRVLAYALATSLMTIGLAFGVAAAVSDDTEQQTNEAVTAINEQVLDTQRLLCDILVNSDNPDIVKAVERYCPPTESP